MKISNCPEIPWWTRRYAATVWDDCRAETRKRTSSFYETSNRTKRFETRNCRPVGTYAEAVPPRFSRILLNRRNARVWRADDRLRSHRGDTIRGRSVGLGPNRLSMRCPAVPILCNAATIIPPDRNVVPPCPCSSTFYQPHHSHKHNRVAVRT